MGKVLYMRKGENHTDPLTGLPGGYTRLASIKSSGTQYIDLDDYPSADLKIEITLTPDASYMSEHAILGAAWAADGFFLMFYQNKLRFHSKGASVDISNVNTTGKNVIVCTQNSITVNGTKYSLNGTGGDVQKPIRLFSVYDEAGYPTSTSKRGVYSLQGCRVWKGDALVNNRVPCINASGAVGLFDMVERKFYGNAGTGAFGAGDVVEYSLPEGYEELAYIESTGTQYCDSGIKGSQNTRIEADYSTTATVGAIIGADSKWGSNMCTIEVHFAAFATSNYTHATVPSGRHTVSLNKGVFSLDGAVLSTMTGTFTTPVNMTLFALNRNGDKQEYGSIKLYSMRIYESDACVRWYVPVITSAGAVGLWDVIGRAFFGNAGTGAFIGSEVAA